MSVFRFRPGFAPIMGFIGANGAGKTAMAVHVNIERARITGAPIWSTVDIKAEGVDVREITQLSDIMNIQRGHVLFDEIASVAPARGTTDQPPEHVLRLASLRHYDATLTWTAPVMEDVDVVIRRVTQWVCSMKPLVVKKRPGQLWPDTRVAFGTMYDLRSVEAVAINSETDKTERGFVRIASLPLDAYDTRAEVELRADHAVCRTCHLPKRREYCRGKHEKATTEQEKTTGTTTAPATATGNDQSKTETAGPAQRIGGHAPELPVRAWRSASDAGGRAAQRYETGSGDTAVPRTSLDSPKASPVTRGPSVAR